MSEPISEVPYAAFILMVISLTFGAGMLAESAIQGMRETEMKDEPKPTAQAKPDRWYVCDKVEVERTCRAQKRMEQVKGKQA